MRSIKFVHWKIVTGKRFDRWGSSTGKSMRFWRSVLVLIRVGLGCRWRSVGLLCVIVLGRWGCNYQRRGLNTALTTAQSSNPLYAIPSPKPNTNPSSVFARSPTPAPSVKPASTGLRQSRDALMTARCIRCAWTSKFVMDMGSSSLANVCAGCCMQASIVTGVSTHAESIQIAYKKVYRNTIRSKRFLPMCYLQWSQVSFSKHVKPPHIPTTWIKFIYQKSLKLVTST